MNINKIMQQAQAMQKKVMEMQEKMANTVYEGASGGNMVKVQISGKGEMKSISIDPSLINAEEVDILEDLIIAAFADAKKKADSDSESNMSGLMGGMGMPSGFKMPF